MNKDLTIIFISASQQPEYWTAFHKKILLEAAGDYPIISVTRKPVDFGLNLIDDKPKCLSNIYWQMLRAAKIATTDYVAIAEDDTLYSKEHFQFCRPPMDTFAYNRNRFTLFTWDEPIFHWRNRISNCSLIAPRKLLIEALEERFAKWPNGTNNNVTGEVGRGMIERNLHITERKCMDDYSKVSVIQVNHENGSENRQKTHRKSYGPIRCYDLYYWRKAEDLVKNYH
jgi:hypothetical protein